MNLVAKAESKLALIQGKGWGGRKSLPHEVKAATSLLKSGRPELVIDVGAHLGAYADSVLKQFPDARLVLFEPSSSNFEQLRSKFQENNRVSLENATLSDLASKRALFSNGPGSSLASMSKRRLDHFGIDFSFSEEVRTLAFKDYWSSKLNSQKIDIMKLDIEGHELTALEGFGPSLKQIEVIQFEFGGCNIDSRTYFQDFWYFFKNSGFDLYRITPLDVRHIAKYSEHDECFRTTNYLAHNRSL